MKEKSNPDVFSQHNREQLEYFKKSKKKTMIPQSSPYVKKHVRRLIQFGNFSKQDDLLEVGCGMGRYTLPLIDMGYQVSGLDLSPHLLERLQGYASDNQKISLYCDDIIDAPRTIPKFFDGIIGFFTLHHLHDLKQSIGAMTRLLKPGGRIVFLEPNAFNPLYYLQMLMTPSMAWEGDKGVADMRWSLINQVMQSVGLKKTEIRRFGFFPLF